MLRTDQVDFFEEHGYLHLKGIFSASEVETLGSDLDWLIESWAFNEKGWSGPWRQAYMDKKTEASSRLIAMHDLHLYARSWMNAVTHPLLCDAAGQLLGGAAELHHSTLHVKPPGTGHPFPMHQDWWFYKHEDTRFIDALVHLDDTCHENGEIRFLDGSHKRGIIPHITEVDGNPCTPHLPTDAWKLEDTVAVPAAAGDVVLFHFHTVHGSYINRTDKMRRLVRVGYRHPHNIQTSGQSLGRYGILVSGRRVRLPGQELLPRN